MLYKCPECSKVYDGYVEKCPECGSRISLSDSVYDAAAKNLENVEETEAKFDLLKRRIRNGYIAIAIYAFIPAWAIFLTIILVIVTVKCHFFSCPHCDVMLSKHNALYSLHCPHCGKRIRKYE